MEEILKHSFSTIFWGAITAGYIAAIVFAVKMLIRLIESHGQNSATSQKPNISNLEQQLDEIEETLDRINANENNPKITTIWDKPSSKK